MASSIVTITLLVVLQGMLDLDDGGILRTMRIWKS